MKLLFIGIILTVLCNLAYCKINEVFLTNLWNQFKKSHGKEYLSEEIEQFRFGLFKENLDKIEKHNYEHAAGIHTYTLGVNHFADWTVEEFKGLLGFRANATKNKEDSTYTFLRLPEEIKLPDSIDWREKGVVTGVKDQGQCGSCWSFSTTGALEGAHARAASKLVSLSEQQLVDCSGKYGNEGCNGGLMDNAFKYVKENGGLDTEESYSYHARQGKCHFKTQNVGATCTGFVDIPSQNEDALKEAVATVGPVSVAIDATEDKFMLYKSGVFVDSTCSNGQNDLDHGVLVVGYGTDKTGNGDADYWIVKNSWGPSWGENGYIRMARNHDNMCGISTAASYPLVK